LERPPYSSKLDPYVSKGGKGLTKLAGEKEVAIKREKEGNWQREAKMTVMEKGGLAK